MKKNRPMIRGKSQKKKEKFEKNKTKIENKNGPMIRAKSQKKEKSKNLKKNILGFHAYNKTKVFHRKRSLIFC